MALVQALDSYRVPSWARDWVIPSVKCSEAAAAEPVAWLNTISPFATVIVAVALVWFTWVLAKGPRRMADAGANLR